MILGLAEGINAEADTAAQAMQNVNNAILDNANAELQSNVKLSAETDYTSGDYTVAFLDPLMMFADRLESIFANANISLNESARYGVNGSGTTINNNSTTGGDYQINAPITVTVEGNADEATAERIGEEVEKVLIDIMSIKNLT